MSRLGQWLRDDLSKVNKPGEIGRTIRRHPMILAVAVLNFVVAMLVIYAVLTLFGNADAFSDWWFLAAIWAGGVWQSDDLRAQVQGRQPAERGGRRLVAAQPELGACCPRG